MVKFTGVARWITGTGGGLPGGFGGGRRTLQRYREISPAGGFGGGGAGGGAGRRLRAIGSPPIEPEHGRITWAESG